jgi:signal peptidase II
MSGGQEAVATAGRPDSTALRWLTLTALVVALDQLSKALILDHYQLYERTGILPFFDIIRLHNRGAAFSFLASAAGWQRYLFTGLAAVVSLGIVVWLARLRARADWLLSAALALVAGGAVGNLIDRVRFGYVIDFIHVFQPGVWDFPAFNLADSAITLGAALLMLDAWRDGRGRT